MRINNPFSPSRLFRTFSTSSSSSSHHIPASEYTERRNKLQQLLVKSSSELRSRNIFALLLSRPKTFSAPDVPHIYRQCSNFRYLCGIDRPQFLLLIGSSESVLFTEQQTAHQTLWDGPGYATDEIQQISGVNQVLPLDEFHKYFVETVREGSQLAVDINSLIGNPIQNLDLKNICKILSSGGLKHISLNEKIDQLRWQKSEREQKMMRESARIGSQALNSMFRECKGVANESHVVGFLEYECRRRGADSLAYPPVVAGGSNANTIHYISSNMPIRPNDCVLVDAGADFHGYVSDITRCFPASGTFSASQKTLLGALSHIQSQLLHYVQNRRPLRFNELYNFMIERMALALDSIVFFRRNLSNDELIKECNQLCPHHVSHYLGMDVHDTPSISREIDCLPGVLFTVEPGIYVDPKNTAIRDEFKGLGFRIEDDILLTDTGAEILTKNCPSDPDEIQFAMRL